MSAEETRSGEARYRRIVEDSPLLICEVDSVGTLTYANPAYCEYFGLDPGEVGGLPITSLMPPDVGPGAWKRITDLTPTAPTMTHEHEVLATDGSVRWQRWTNRARFDADGRVVEYVAIGGDVTERHRIEAALRDREARIASIFRAAPIGIGLVVDRVLTRVNDRICELVGRERDELLGKSARILYPDDEEYERVGRDKYEMIVESGAGTVETIWLRKDGEPIHVLLSSAPLDPDDLSLGVTFTALDISDRKRAEADRERLGEQIRQAQKLESLGILAGGVAHDFNNLLTAILGNADLAMQDLTPASPTYPKVRAIDEASRRAAELCRQMLAYSGRVRFVVEPVILSDLVADSSHMISGSISKDAAVRYDLAADLPHIEADVPRMQQVILSLLTNASEAIEGEQGSITVRTGVRSVSAGEVRGGHLEEDLPAGRYVFLEVVDTGAGMDEETVERVFDPFFTTKFQGRGLGLSAVLGIVRGHSGAIVVESRPGEGATFRVFLPAVPTG